MGELLPKTKPKADIKETTFILSIQQTICWLFQKTQQTFHYCTTWNWKMLFYREKQADKRSLITEHSGGIKAHKGRKTTFSKIEPKGCDLLFCFVWNSPNSLLLLDSISSQTNKHTHTFTSRKCVIGEMLVLRLHILNKVNMACDVMYANCVWVRLSD